MRTKKINLYQFNELDEHIRDAVIERERYANVECIEWYEYEEEIFTKKVKKLGFNDVKTHFSGFGSQGDGASFDATVNLIDYMEENDCMNKKTVHVINRLEELEGYNENALEIIVKVQNGHYVHREMMKVDYDFSMMELTEKQDDILHKLFAKILEHGKELADKLYDDLEKEYYELIADKAVKDTLQANEWEFLENGELAPA